MGTRKGRRIAVAFVGGVCALGGTLAWLGRERIRFVLAFESVGRNAPGYDEFGFRRPR